MKLLKIAAIATMITAIIILSCAVAMSAEAEEFYPKLAIVTGTTRIESHLWVVDCQDKDGNIWAFFDDEGEWSKGDIVNLLMWNTGDREEENEIVEVYWEGYTENTDFFFQMEGWR